MPFFDFCGVVAENYKKLKNKQREPHSNDQHYDGRWSDFRINLLIIKPLHNAFELEIRDFATALICCPKDSSTPKNPSYELDC